MMQVILHLASSNVLKYYDGSAWQTTTSDTDVKTKVSSNDTVGFLNGKLVAGSNISSQKLLMEEMKLCHCGYQVRQQYTFQ